MKKLCLLVFLLAACTHPKNVSTSFYYWKTVYQNTPTQTSYLQRCHVRKLYVRMMDVDFTTGNLPSPVSPIVFKSRLPDTIEIVPVVFIVNDIFRKMDTAQIKTLAHDVIPYVDTKIKESGKKGYGELQIDCDWTATTRDNYFFLLKEVTQITHQKRRSLSVTLRLHQLKNQKTSGIPPADRVMLMCYNMGNLRKYGDQNSILELSELKKYLGGNLSTYPIPSDIGLPLFSWAVAFRNQQYIGISKKLNLALLTNKNQFKFIGNNLYKATVDLPEYGLLNDDEVRWESVSENNLNQTAQYISSFIKTDSLNVIYFHLDNDLINTYTYANLEKTTALFR